MTKSLLITIAIIILIALLDFVNMWRANRKKFAQIESKNKSDDFTLLIPFWGNMELLTKLGWTGMYEDNLLICTTDREKPAVYAALEELGLKYVKLDVGKGKVNPFKLLKEGVKHVRTTNVIFVDADTYPNGELGYLVSTFVKEGLDLSSVRILPSNKGRLMAKLQNIEYSLAMDARKIYPWLTSGAGMISKTNAMSNVLSNHSLFFNGGDIEIGKLFKILKYKVGHIPFIFLTEVPETFKGWFVQRIKWMAGAFRHSIINAYIHNWKYPFHFFYFVLLVFIALPFKWTEAINHPWILVLVLIVYTILPWIFRSKNRMSYPIIYSLYCLIQVLVILPLGVMYYIKNVIKYQNIGLIKIRNEESLKRLTGKDHTINFFGGFVALSILIIITYVLYFVR